MLHLLFYAVIILLVTIFTGAVIDDPSSGTFPSNLSVKSNLRHHHHHRRTDGKDTTTTAVNTISARKYNINSSSRRESTATCSTEIKDRGMTYTDVKRSAIAARLSSLVYEFGDDPYVDTTSDKMPYGFMNNQGTYYMSENSIDAVYTVQINNDYCAVAFRGTTLRNWDIGLWLQDLHSNILLCPIEYNSNNNENRTTDDGSNGGDGNDNGNGNGDGDSGFCDIHRGYYEAFVHINGVETFLDSCHNNCPECDILLTGHSQGGSIAEVAGLYLKDRFSADTVPYVITTGAPEALGAGCFDLFTEEERCHWYHYILTIEDPFGKGIVYDPFTMLYSQHLDDEKEQTYARYGGLAFVGHEIFISSNDPTSMLYGGFDDHRPVGMGAYGNFLTSHNDNVYADVLERQLDILFDYSYGNVDRNNDGECFIPTSGFSIGSICNLDDDYSSCANGLECKSNNGWWMFGPPDSCQPINNNDDGSSNGIDNRFCHSQ